MSNHQGQERNGQGNGKLDFCKSGNLTFLVPNLLPAFGEGRRQESFSVGRASSK
jgi:hypothetical protein